MCIRDSFYFTCAAGISANEKFFSRIDFATFYIVLKIFYRFCFENFFISFLQLFTLFLQVLLIYCLAPSDLVRYSMRCQGTRGVQIADASVRGCGTAAIFNIRGCLKKPKLWMRIIRGCRPARVFIFVIFNYLERLKYIIS